MTITSDNWRFTCYKMQKTSDFGVATEKKRDHAKIRISEGLLKGTTHLKLIIPLITAISDFEQRWRQRGKTTDCSFNVDFEKILITSSETNNKCRLHGQTCYMDGPLKDAGPFG